ncbi:MAG: hypothetical protein JWO82_885 [Akkermansiaceae bacterium]|nr:hypothetical protein [Akkermansiaceae bacterium]
MTAKNSRALALVLHLLVLAAIAALFITGRNSGFAAQQQAFTEHRDAFDAATGSSRPLIGQIYTAGLDQQASGLLDRAHDLQIATARISRVFYDRVAGLAGCAAFLVLSALFLIFRNCRMTRNGRIGILTSHSFICLVLLMVLGVAVLGHQLALRVETASVPPNLLSFRASSPTQIDKLYTAKRREALFQFLQIDSSITNELLETMQSGEKAVVSGSGLLAGLAILDLILVIRLRSPETL